MNQNQEDHAMSLVSEITQLLIAKYKKGAEEHNSDLLDMPTENLLDNAIEESIDNLVYLLTLKEKLTK